MSTKNDHTEWTTSFNQEDMARRYKTAEAITRPFAKDMIERVGLLNPGLDNLIILDNACGTGIVAAALHDMLDDSTKRRMKLTCGDFAEPMLDACRKRIEENGWMHTEARKVDAQVCFGCGHCCRLGVCKHCMLLTRSLSFLSLSGRKQVSRTKHSATF